MTVITPIGVLITSFFATAQVFAAIKHASSLPCYQNSCLAKLAFAVWCFIAFQAAFWGIGVNVFFNESWGESRATCSVCPPARGSWQRKRMLVT